jgi:hypothetical protein
MDERQVVDEFRVVWSDGLIDEFESVAEAEDFIRLIADTHGTTLAHVIERRQIVTTSTEWETVYS